MIDKTLMAMLVCPESRAPLRPAATELIERLNRAAAAGTLRNRGGQPVARALEAGLVRDDGAVLYPVVDGIPILLIDESILLADDGSTPGGAGSSAGGLA